MFKLANEKDKNKIESFCEEFPLGVRIACYINAYGFERDFFKTWYSQTEEEVTAAISSFDGSVTICAKENADFEELEEFLKVVGFQSVCAEQSVFEKLSLNEGTRKSLFRFEGESVSFEEVKNGGNMKKVYNLISSSIPHAFPENEEAYLHFLSDFTFRERRNLARVKTITKEDKVLSCALTAAETDFAAMISGVACDSTQRGKGIGKKTVLTLAGELKSENKNVYVIALNDSACAFYEKIGFKKIETVCYSK